MAESRNLSDLVAESLEALDAYDAAQPMDTPDDNQRLPTPGGVYILEDTAEHSVEWIVVAHDPADAERFLVVPADGNFLVGSEDLELEDTVLGTVVARCRWGIWVDAEFFDPGLRAAVLGTEDVARIRRKWLDVGDGRTTGSILAQEVDADPAYTEWIEDVVAPARQALLKGSNQDSGNDGGPEPESVDVWPPRDRDFESAQGRRRIGFKVAASVAVALAAVQFWRLSERMDDIQRRNQSIEQEYLAKVDDLVEHNHILESERDILTLERDTLKDERDRLELSLETMNGANRDAEQLKARVADLDRRLAEAEKAAEVINVEVLTLDGPGRTDRGIEEISLGPGQSHVLLSIPLSGPKLAERYRVELRRGETPVWESDRLALSLEGELWFGIPSTALGRGRYSLVLWELRDGEPAELERYLLDVTKP